jgi:hypothetical protein
MARYGSKILFLLLFLTVISALIPLLTACGSSAAVGLKGSASVTLSWVAPEFNEDDSPLTNLAGYRIYYGETSGTYTDSVTITGKRSSTTVIGNLSNGSTIHFVVTAFNLHGNESAYSNEIMTTMPGTN